MTIVKIKINPDEANFLRLGRIDTMNVDSTTEQDIAVHEAIDASEAMQDMSKFVRRVRTSLGLNQSEFSRLLNVSFDTVSKWEQGKRFPRGAAKVLLKIIDKFPESTFAALQ